ncbi:Hypothetical_protein [Hexamita inflata]|uniref:Hypothetical_protein n=1 Tax=Hexamita inflata TaxID=28002 RepID=A0AA86N571_9EUKA|nr:Hypothetical protein HINF_LOCUS638 [Hexamita inflata]
MKNPYCAIENRQWMAIVHLLGYFSKGVKIMIKLKSEKKRVHVTAQNTVMSYDQTHDEAMKIRQNQAELKHPKQSLRCIGIRQAKKCREQSLKLKHYLPP